MLQKHRFDHDQHILAETNALFGAAAIQYTDYVDQGLPVNDLIHAAQKFSGAGFLFTGVKKLISKVELTGFLHLSIWLSYWCCYTYKIRINHY